MTAGKTLREHAEEYLAMRRALGFSLATFGIRLDSFITWLESTGATVITADAAIAWATATRRGSTDPAYLARRLDVARIFARHMRVLDPATGVPPMDVLSRRYRRITPHLYPPGEMAEILKAAGELPPPLRAATWQTLLSLLAATGMRVSEACRLDRGDADLEAGVLTIRDSKFGKSRDIPVHPTAVTALRRYEQIRDRLCPAPVTTAFFVSTRGTRIDSHNMPQVFARLTETAGITAAAGRRRPRIHDIRHTFTVRSLLDWHRDGADVQARLPLLSAYLGHVDPKSSYWYMTGSPELLALAAARLSHAFGGQP
jgi:integrase/recombinase XerD